MTWVDLVAILLFIAGAVVESMRGFGRALFDAIALIIAAKASTMLYPGLAERIAISQDTHANQAWCLALLFVVIGTITILLAKLIQDSLLLSLDAFDPILGAILGIPAAGAVVYALMAILITGAGGPEAETAKTYVQSWAAYHFYYFKSYHSMIDTFRRIGE